MSDVQILFKLLQEKSLRPNVTELDVKNMDTTRTQNSLFYSEGVKRAHESLPEELKERYKKYGDQYYNQVIDDIQSADQSKDTHAQNLLAYVKSGGSPSDLSEDERLILRNVFGNDWHLLANIKDAP